MNVVDQARKLRRIIEQNAESMNAAEALESQELFPNWNGKGVSYAAGQRVRHAGLLYKVLQAHTSQPDWTPLTAPSLFAEVLISDTTTIPEWRQPDSTSPYAKGDKVTHNGQTWTSAIDGNVWEPGVYGWDAE